MLASHWQWYRGEEGEGVKGRRRREEGRREKG